MNTIETNLSAFNSTLARYLEFTSKLPSEALEHKGRDLGIKLYQGFSRRKWGGDGKKRAGLARAELATRTAQHVGTTVRRSLLKEYLGLRGRILADRRRAKQKGSISGQLTSIRKAVRLWQQFVGREISLRQRGIGVLAASFLWFRSRSSQARGTYYVRNNTGRPLGGVERTEGSFRIFGETAGLAEVDARYGIVAGALAIARDDMVTYLKERHAEGYFKLFGEMPA
jgi:hypothetical protein